MRRDWRRMAAGRGPRREAPGSVRRQGRKSGQEPFLWFLWEATARQGQQACSAGEKVFSGSGWRGCPSCLEPALGALALPCPGTDQLSRVRGPRRQNIRKQTIKRCGEHPCPNRPREEGLAWVALLGPLCILRVRPAPWASPHLVPTLWQQRGPAAGAFQGQRVPRGLRGGAGPGLARPP